VYRFPPIVEEYKLAEGTGKNVGVEGRDIDVGMELTVDAVVLVLVLPSDKRDCGRRIPVSITLWLKALELRVLPPNEDDEG
jgi:hypothetical protein